MGNCVSSLIVKPSLYLIMVNGINQIFHWRSIFPIELVEYFFTVLNKKDVLPAKYHASSY